jgi:hypothetical protein
VRWLLVVALVGCGLDPTLQVHVTDDAGADIAGATVQALCDPLGVGAAAYTDATGLARLVLFFEHEPQEPCVLTVSHVGFRTFRADDVEPCPTGEACAAIELALPRVP